jgi:DNA repair protein RadD
VICHRKELIQQDYEKIRALLPPETDIGIFSAGLNRRDTDHSIIVAGIQSVFKKAYDVGARNIVIIDECHLVKHEDEGMYRTFLNDLRSANPKIRVIGLTATPYRLDSGAICRPDAIFQKVCFSADIIELINAGYLSRLITKPSTLKIDTNTLHIRGGEFVAIEAEGLFNRATEAACVEIVAATQDRKSVLVFCSGVNHTINVAQTLERLTGETCGIVLGDTTPLERSATLDAFQNRKLRFLVGCDVLTVGFDAPVIDCICLLRATCSPGLYSQMAGRGFRLYPGKEISHALVLDFGENVARHGPLDNINFGKEKHARVPGEIPLKTCPNCQEELILQCRECPECGFIFEVERKPVTQADTDSPILSEPENWLVEEVYYAIHEKKKKADGPLTMRVDYVCHPLSGEGNLTSKQISEWVCIEHEGYAWKKAAAWWKARSIAPMPATVEEAVELARCGALATPDRITTQRDGRWYRILSARLDERPTEWAASEEEMMDGIPF